MGLATTHETSRDYARRCLADLNYMRGLLTGANGFQAGDSTIVLFKARVSALMLGAEDRRADQILKAIDFCSRAGVLTDADVALAASKADPTARLNNLCTTLAGCAEGTGSPVNNLYNQLAGATP